MTPSARLSALAINAALLGTSFPATAGVIADLDQCLAEPAKTQAVFTERFPHETCDIATSCDPKLVQSAEILARDRCRRAAIESCESAPHCIARLTTRWATRSTELSAELSERWSNTDPATLPKLVVRRLNSPDAFALSTGCSDAASCSEQALENLIRMERVDRVLPSPPRASGIEGWYNRCNAAAPERLTNVVRTDWPGYHSCVIYASMQCRFATNPRACIAQLDAVFAKRSAGLRQDIPELALGEGTNQRLMQIGLDFYHETVSSGTQSDFISPGDKDAFAWLGAEMQAKFVQHLFYLGVLPSLREKLNLRAVP